MPARIAVASAMVVDLLVAATVCAAALATPGCGESHEMVCAGPTHRSCPEGQYCDEGLDCGRDAPGVCRPLSDLDAEADQPVCGCDRITYANERALREAGADLRWPSSCECDPVEAWDRGGCIPLLTEFFWDGVGCHNPWCECFGRDCGIYEDDDYDVAREECRVAKAECSGVTIACGEGRPSCPAGTYCDYPGVQACVGEGRCLRSPQTCDDDFRTPITGCDGRDYESVCEAYRNGTDWLCEPGYCRTSR